MTRGKILGLAIMAVVAISAVASASASAGALPAFTNGVCGSVTAGTGWGAESLCKTESGTKAGNFELGFVADTFTGVTGESTLETVGGTKVTCKAGLSEGKISGPKTTTGNFVTFTGCKSNGFPCKNASESV